MVLLTDQKYYEALSVVNSIYKILNYVPYFPLISKAEYFIIFGANCIMTPSRKKN